MLEPGIQKKLEALKNLPAMPAVASAVLQEVENPKLSAAQLAAMIERDPALTARVLSVANSPFYGFVRRVATVELAVVLLGLSSVKEVVLSIIVQRIFAKIDPKVLSINAFWHYSVFCGVATRHFARKLGYRVVGEGFVAGLMHDIGVLFEAQFLTGEYLRAKEYMATNNCSFLEAEMATLGCTHCDIGGWFAERWKLPQQLHRAISYHHQTEDALMQSGAEDSSVAPPSGNRDAKSNSDTLTGLVALGELFAGDMGYKAWLDEQKVSLLNLPESLVSQMQEAYRSEEDIDGLKEELRLEYESALEFTRG